MNRVTLITGLLLTGITGASACNRPEATPAPPMTASLNAPAPPGPRAPPGHYQIIGDDLIFSPEATDVDMAILDAHPHIKRIAFAQGPNATPPARVTGAGLAHLAAVKQLERLDLSAIRVTDDAISPVARLSNLRELWLDFSDALTDRVFDHIAPLEDLRVLRFHGAKITDTGLRRITHLAKLEDLQLGRAAITDAGLAAIGGFSELRTLDLQHTAITDRGMPHLRSLRKLRWLAVNDTAVSGSGLASIEDLTNLEWLFAVRTATDDASLAHLAKLARLHDLDLSGTKVTDAGMAHLTRVTSLERLLLDDCPITDQGLRTLASITPLKWLSLRGATVSRAAIDEVRVKRPDLKIMNLTRP